MAEYGARDRDGGEDRERLDGAAREAPRGWTAPVARIERGADGRVRLRVGGRRVEPGGGAPSGGG